VFGQVTSGMEAVDAIEGTATGAGDRPVEDQKIERVELSD
jgi:cyclophilin family peptidyl-prolyl cis-trans isomerase